MIVTPTISDHALLRYMERVHGIDMPLWRSLMQGDLDVSLAAYQAFHAPGRPAFVLSSTNRVVTVIDGLKRFGSIPGSPRIAVPLVA